jgi:competence protein ComEC
LDGISDAISDVPPVAVIDSATAAVASSSATIANPLESSAGSSAPSESYQPLLLLLVPVGVGICADRYLLPGLSHSFAVEWSVSLAAIVLWLLLWKVSSHVIGAISLCVAIAAAAGAWHDLRRNYFNADDLGRYATESSQPICCEAVAVSAPQQVPPPPSSPLRSIPPSPQNRLLVEIVALRDGADWRSASGTARVSVESEHLDIHASDRLRILGHLSAPSPADNPGDIDYAEFARDERQLSQIRVKNSNCIRVIQSASVWNPTRWLDSLRQGGTLLFDKFISHGRAGLASAVLLGEREHVDEDTNEAFLETGTIHILCIAGLHIGIVAALLFAIFGMGWLPRRTAIVCVMAILGAYMLLTLARPPVMRATLLVWIVCGGTLLGRRSWGWNSLALAGLIVLAVNPAGLMHTGVQLSFLSVAAIIWAAPKFFGDAIIDPLDRLIAATRPWLERLLNSARRYVFEMFVVGLAI